MERETLKRIRVDINKALEAVEEKYDITLEFRGITFDTTGFSTKLTGTQKTKDGRNARQLQDWDRAVKLEIVEPEWMGLVLEDGYKITGYDPKKQVNCIMLEKISTGKPFICNLESARRRADRALLVK